MQFLVVPKGHPLRPGVERFIADVYRSHYSASVTSFPPLLVAMLSASGTCVCASGLRFAQTGFFSECYLDGPIEHALSDAVGESVHRSHIFEVTGLASRAPRAATHFLHHIVAYGESMSFDWAFFTATGRLRELLGAIGLPPRVLAPADPRRLRNAEIWGTYYDAAPMVCAISRAAVSCFLSHQTRPAAYA